MRFITSLALLLTIGLVGCGTDSGWITQPEPLPSGQEMSLTASVPLEAGVAVGDSVFIAGSIVSVAPSQRVYLGRVGIGGVISGTFSRVVRSGWYDVVFWVKSRINGRWYSFRSLAISVNGTLLTALTGDTWTGPFRQFRVVSDSTGYSIDRIRDDTLVETTCWYSGQTGDPAMSNLNENLSAADSIFVVSSWGGMQRQPLTWDGGAWSGQIKAQAGKTEWIRFEDRNANVRVAGGYFGAHECVFLKDIGVGREYLVFEILVSATGAHQDTGTDNRGFVINIGGNAKPGPKL